MRKINKVDYFCGAFLSYLISNKVEPTLFEAGDKSKIVEFTIRATTYKVFLKYSTKKKTVKKQGKIFDRWEIVFAPNEILQIENFAEPSKKVAVICICTDEKLHGRNLTGESPEHARWREGIPKCYAGKWGYVKAYWNVAGSPILQRSITNERLARAGYYSLSDRYESLHLCD